jgi:hypothetical protein
MLTEGVLAKTGIDAVALKPTEVDLSRAASLAVDAVVDYEGRDTLPDAWVGTESVERVALAAGGPQFELLSRTTERDLHALRAALPDGAATDATATGRAREVLTQAVRDYALVGDGETVENRVERLREAGADTVIAHPARGLDALGR